MATKRKLSPVYLWVHLSPMEQVLWAAAYADAVGSPSVRARFADTTVRSLRELDSKRDGTFGPEYEAARRNVMLEVPEFEAWYRVQAQIDGPSKTAPSKKHCLEAYERYRRGLGDFY